MSYEFVSSTTADELTDLLAPQAPQRTTDLTEANFLQLAQAVICFILLFYYFSFCISSCSATVRDWTFILIELKMRKLGTYEFQRKAGGSS